MKQKTLVFILVFSALFLSGCYNSSSSEYKNEGKNQTDSLIELEANNNQVVEKFYPENTQIAKSINSATDQFVITQELQIKFYLVDKYDPGICYGMPEPVPDVAVDGMIDRNPDLVNLIRSKYSLTDNLAVYNKIKQLNGIRLSKLTGGKYQFNLTDGQCCILTAYEGEVSIVGRSISDKVIRRESKNNPC